MARSGKKKGKRRADPMGATADVHKSNELSTPATAMEVGGGDAQTLSNKAVVAPKTNKVATEGPSSAMHHLARQTLVEKVKVTMGSLISAPYRKIGDLDWATVAFGKYDADTCRKEYDLLCKGVSKVKNCMEVAEGAAQKAAEIKKPKMPSAAANYFINKKYAELPEEQKRSRPVFALRNDLRAQYNLLRPEKKKRYEKLAAADKRRFQKEIQDYKY